MAVNQQELSRWFKEGVEKGATHMIVACDTFDWTDYPIYVMPGVDVREVETEYDGPNMQKVMEVYSLRMDMATQLNEWRAFRYD